MNAKVFTIALAILISSISHGQHTANGRPVAGDFKVIETEPADDHIARQAEPVEVVDIEPGIELKAPLTCEVGELVEFSAVDSNVDSMVWEIIPKTKDFKVVTKERIAFFSARAESSGQAFRLILAGAKDGEAFLVHQVLTVKGPTIAPTGLTFKIGTWLQELPEDVEDRDQKLRGMAGVFRQLAKDGVDVDEILNATAIANTAILNGGIEAWYPFLDRMGDEIDSLSEAGKLDTPEQYKKVWLEIAKALDANAGK